MGEADFKAAGASESPLSGHSPTLTLKRSGSNVAQHQFGGTEGTMDPPAKSSVAFHESGHAVATVAAFQMAKWLPRPRPSVLVRRVEITQDAAGEWTGHCVATNIYSTGWPRHRIASRYRPLMQSQITIHLAGGLAEAAHRGVRRKDAILAYAMDHCCMDEDMTRARAVLDDLNSLAGRKYDEQHFAGRARVHGVVLASGRGGCGCAARSRACRRREGRADRRLGNGGPV